MVQKPGNKPDSKAPLHIAIYDWGYNASRFFPGLSSETQLWQLQIIHEVHNGVGFQTGSAIDEVLHKFKGGEAKSAKAMEAHHGIRYTNTNGKDEKFDRNDVGMVPWRGALYIANSDFKDALVLLGLVAKRKVECGHLASLPSLHVIGESDELVCGTLPDGWSYKKVTDMPSPFAAAPPRGYHHLVLQVERDGAPSRPVSRQADPTADQKEEEQSHKATAEQSRWTILLFGGIYEFRREFDSLNIEGGYIDVEGENRPYVRTLPADLQDSSKAMVMEILGDGVFKHAPVALLNATGDSADDMVAWLSEQPSVFPLK